jgi:glycosyltransferase involved in cell wall biosynthesis
MRIVIDARLIDETGVGRYIRNLIRELAFKDKTNTYILLLRSQSASHFISPGDNWIVRVVDIPWHSVQEQLRLPFVLLSLKADVVHIPYFTIPVFYPGRMVVTIHDLIVSHFATGRASTHAPIFYSIKRLFYFLIVWVGLKRAWQVIAVSNATKQELISHYAFVRHKVHVTYEGVDPLLESHGKVSQNTTPKLPYLLYVGNFYPHKNVETLIHAYKESGVGVALLMLGKDDIFRARIESLVESLGIQSSVIFLPTCTDRELSDLYTHAVSLVVPTFMEGFSLPPLEALSVGCPVICSDIPVHREILAHLPTYFKPTDIKELASCIERAVSQKKTVSKQEVGALLKKYSWKTMADQTHAIYTHTARFSSEK